MHETETRRKTRNLLSSLVGTNIYCQCVLTRNSSLGAKPALAIRVDFTFRSYEAIDLMGISNYKYFAPTELRNRHNRINHKRITLRMAPPLSYFWALRPLPYASLLVVLVLAPACVKRSRVVLSSNKPNESANQATQKEANDQQPTSVPKTNQLININTASANELETLPGIGKGLAQRIIDHREKFGTFRRPEHLIIVRGISDRRFRALRDLVTVE